MERIYLVSAKPSLRSSISGRRRPEEAAVFLLVSNADSEMFHARIVVHEVHIKHGDDKGDR